MGIFYEMRMGILDLQRDLKTKLSHGDYQYRKWLDQAIDSIFEGDEPPEVYGKATKQLLIEQLEEANKIAEHLAEVSFVEDVDLDMGNRYLKKWGLNEKT